MSAIRPRQNDVVTCADTGTDLRSEEEATLDRVDDALRQLLQARRPVRSADLATVRTSLSTTLLFTASGSDGDPGTL